MFPAPGEANGTHLCTRALPLVLILSKFLLKLKFSHQECIWEWDSFTLVHGILYHQPAHKIMLRILFFILHDAKQNEFRN